MRIRSAVVVLVALVAGAFLWSCGGGGESTHCGNATLDLGEECDDANRIAGDGCDSSCRIECGNGTIDQGEECDDSNRGDGDGCSAACKLECGNGVLDPGEQCDDGNRGDDDACRSDCTTNVDRCASFVSMERIAPDVFGCHDRQRRIDFTNDSFCYVEIASLTNDEHLTHELGSVNCSDPGASVRPPNKATSVAPLSTVTIDEYAPWDVDCSGFTEPRECREPPDNECDGTITVSVDVRFRATPDQAASFVAGTVTAPTGYYRETGLCYLVDD